MKKKLLAMAGEALLSLSPLAPAQQSSTQEVVRAADSFLAILTPDQRQKVMYAFDDAAQRARWSNFPTGVVARGGIGLKQVTTAQQDAAMKLMATLRRPMGMQKVSEIRDDDFKANGSKRGRGGRGPRPQGPPPGGQSGPAPFGGRGPGGPPTGGDLFGSDLYYIFFLGTPSTTAPWMLQFGGHHLALNITIDGDKGVLTPTLTGAQPATFTLNGKIVRPLGRTSA